MSTAPTSQTDVIGRLLTGHSEELTGAEWLSLHEAVGALIAEVQQLAPRGSDSAVFAIEEAARKLSYAPTAPNPLYAAKLARCGQALRRHRARLTRADSTR